MQVYKPVNPEAKMQEWLDEYSGATATMLRDDHTVQIDGHNARWLTVVYPPLTRSKSQVQEVVWLLTEDRFYTIELNIPESEINGRPQKEFEALIKTIKVLP